MNKKYIIIFVLLFLIALIAGVFTIKKLKAKTQEEVSSIEEEYTPEEEITEEQTQNRDTIVTVYYLNKETGKIMPEARVVDVREMINNPYQTLMQLLVEGPKSEKLERIVPEKTMILGTTLKDDCVTINVSSEILNFDKQKDNVIASIVNTLTELNEVNKVKIIVEGQENNEFNQVYEKNKNEKS